MVSGSSSPLELKLQQPSSWGLNTFANYILDEGRKERGCKRRGLSPVIGCHRPIQLLAVNPSIQILLLQGTGVKKTALGQEEKQWSSIMVSMENLAVRLLTIKFLPQLLGSNYGLHSSSLSLTSSSSSGNADSFWFFRCLAPANIKTKTLINHPEGANH